MYIFKNNEAFLSPGVHDSEPSISVEHSMVITSQAETLSHAQTLCLMPVRE